MAGAIVLQQLVVLRQVLPWRVASSFAVVGLAAAGFGALGSRASVWQLPDSGNVRCTIRTLEPTSVEKTTEPGAAKPDAGKAAGPSTPIPADATINNSN